MLPLAAAGRLVAQAAPVAIVPVVSTPVASFSPAALSEPGAVTLLSADRSPAVSSFEPSSSSVADTDTDLPDAPFPAGQQSGAASAPPATDPATPPPGHVHPVQTKRILGIMPNFRSVTADEQLPPQTVKDKFVIAAKDSFDYSSFIIAGIQSGIAEAEGSYPEFGGGVSGYGQYFWHTLLDTADENFMVGGAFPAIFHQDSRFYTLGHGSAGHRALYAASRILITRSDSGRRAPNFAEVIGAGAASGISSTYYPEVYRTWTKVGQKWLTSMIIDSANFTFKEFWPDINSHVFHTH